MGKTPEKVVSSAAPMMRYRRKVPSAPAVAAAEVPVAVETNQQGDNQMEHREAEPVVGDDHVKRDERPQTLKQKPLNPGGAARKKKPKGNANAKEADGKSNEASVEATGAAVEIVAVPKKKLKKRQLASNHNDNKGAEAEEPPSQQVCADQDVQLVKPKPTSNRKRKSDVNSDKRKGPSLLKQLLWKAKPSSPADAASQDVGVPPPALSPAALGKQHHHKQMMPKRSPRPSVEDRDEQEEMAYTVSERHSRKLQASKTAVQPQPIATDWCSSAAAAATALSSQETQSGSDDDEASSVFMSAFENLVPSSAIQPTDLSTAVQMNVFYPVPFPLALTTDIDACKQQGLRVHEVLIENFAFHPPQLHIRPGDVVVWRVSGETLGMVEHSLEASLMMRGSQQKKPTFVKATTPPLGSGTSFAWRFEMPARIQIECSVYKTKGVVLVKHPKNNKKKTLTTDKAALPAPSCDVPVDAPAAPQPAKKQQKRKEKGVDRKRAAADARVAAVLPDGDQECGRDSMDSDVAVFHRPHDLARSAELDAGVCQEVLTQLEEVVAAVHAATEVIVIGDVECPVVPDFSNQDESENPAVRMSTHVDSLDKPFALADEWSGTEEDDDDEDRSALCHAEESTIEDFQQQVIGMLKRSEEARAQHRRSFQQEESGFDAGAAYDFFKQRFQRVQEERQIVYAVCPEQQCGSGMGLTDVVSLLLSESSI